MVSGTDNGISKYFADNIGVTETPCLVLLNPL